MAVMVGGRRCLRTLLAVACTAAALTALPALAAPQEVSVPLADGTRLVVEPSPLSLSMVDVAGRPVVSTVPGSGLGWLAGVSGTVSDPAPPFMGNDVAGGAAGAPVFATALSAVRHAGSSTVLVVDTPAGAAQLTVRALPGGGAQVVSRPPAGLPAVTATVLQLASPRGEALFGLGGRHDGFDQRGRVATGWTEQQNVGAGPFAPATDPALGPDYEFPNGAQATYYPQAVLFGLRGWSVWERSTARYDVDLAHTRPGVIRWVVDDRTVAWGLAGGGLAHASAAFTGAIGRAPAPPAWTHQPWIDVINQGEGEAAPMGAGFTGGVRVAHDAAAIAAARARYRLPIGVIGMEGWQVVPDVARLSARLRRAGLHLSAYWNPFVAPSNPAYPPAAARGLLISDPAGQPYPVATDRGSTDRALDFTNPATTPYWLSQLLRSCAALGFDGWMEDYGELVTEGMRFHDRASPVAEHNAYPEQYHHTGAAAARACRAARPGAQPYFYVRAGFTTTPSVTPGAFPGDETTDWSSSSGIASVVPIMLNMALGGVTAFSTDIGGYLDLTTPRTTPELLTRWAQLAAFTSVMRLHNSTEHGELYPWQAGGAALDAYRRYARVKVRLAPLVDRLSRHAARTGTVGPVRPLVLDDPSSAAAGVDDEWLLGDDILVAPVLTRGARFRSVYLPRGGRWRQVRVVEDGSFVPVGAVYPGGRRVNAPAPLSDIPVFLRQ